MIYRILKSIFISGAVAAALLLLYLAGRTLWVLVEIAREVL